MTLPKDALDTPEAQQFWEKVDEIFAEAAESGKVGLVTIISSALQAASFAGLLAGANEADFLMMSRMAWRNSAKQISILRAEIDATEGKAAKA